MVRTALPAALIILLLPLGTALSFQVDVAEVTDHSVKDFNYSEEVENVQKIEGTVENIGSIGCTYRFKAEFTQGNDTFERYSPPSGLWQGAYNELTLHYVPMNYTGLVNTTVYLDYCDQQEKIESFTFNVTENTLPGEEVNSRTIESDELGARVEVGEGDILIPEEAPSYWKTGSANIENGTANIQYEAPIFSSSESITYSVVEDNRVVGRTEVSLEPEPNLKESLQDHLQEILLILLGVSVVLNFGMFLKGRGLAERIKSLKHLSN